MLLTEAKKDFGQVSRLNNKKELQTSLPSAIADNKAKYLLFNTSIRKQLNFKSEQVSPVNSLKLNESVLQMSGGLAHGKSKIGAAKIQITQFDLGPQVRSPSQHGPHSKNKNGKIKETEYESINMNYANLINQSTDNILRPEYQKFYDLNQRSKQELSDNKNQLFGKALRNSNQSTSLGITKRSIDGININIESKNFTQTTYQTSLAVSSKQRKDLAQSMNYSQDQRSGKLPSIFDTYLKMNPISTSNKNSNKKTIALMEQSSILDMTHEQLVKLASPSYDVALQEAKKRFLNTTLRKKITSKISQNPTNYVTKFSNLENSIINESSEDPMSTGINFRPKLQQNSTLDKGVINIDSSSISKTFDEKKQKAGFEGSSKRWNLLQNLDFLDDEEDAANFDLQIPNYDPVCFCKVGQKNMGIKDQPCTNHDSIEGMIELINNQFTQVQQLNLNVDDECEFLDKSIKKIVFLRGHSFYDSVMAIINDKDQEIQELKHELSKLIIMKKDNEILRMHLNQMQDDQDYMKEKVTQTKQQRSLLERLETVVKELKISLSSKENELIDLQERMSSKIKETKVMHRHLIEEKIQNQSLIERIENLELQVKKVNKENHNLRKFIDGEVHEIETRDSNLIQKGLKLLNSNYKLNNSNVMSQNIGMLEDEVENMNMIRYLAIAAVDVKNNRDIAAGIDLSKSIE
eukprot:403331668